MIETIRKTNISDVEVEGVYDKNNVKSQNISSSMEYEDELIVEKKAMEYFLKNEQNKNILTTNIKLSPQNKNIAPRLNPYFDYCESVDNLDDAGREGYGQLINENDINNDAEFENAPLDDGLEDDNLVDGEDIYVHDNDGRFEDVKYREEIQNRIKEMTNRTRTDMYMQALGMKLRDDENDTGGDEDEDEEDDFQTEDEDGGDADGEGEEDTNDSDMNIAGEAMERSLLLPPLPPLDGGSEDADEWADDNDSGYITVSLSESEFFEMEEVSVPTKRV